MQPATEANTRSPQLEAMGHGRGRSAVPYEVVVASVLATQIQGTGLLQVRARGRQRGALLDEVVMASALATRPKMDLWSAGRSLVVPPAPVMLATTAAAPAVGRRCCRSMLCMYTGCTSWKAEALKNPGSPGRWKMSV